MPLLRVRPQRRARLCRRATGRGAHADRGAVSLELAVVFPVVMLLIMAAIQAGLWFHARSVALTAAQRGVENARRDGAPLQDGLDRAQAFLDRAGSALKEQRVTGSSDAQQVSVEVSGSVATLVPGWTLTVDQSAKAPRERFTTAGGP